MTVEQRLEQLEKRNKRLTVALTMTVVAMCAVVTVAAKDDKISTFDKVKARYIAVTNEAGEIVVTLGANDAGGGLVRTMSAKGKDLVNLTSTDSGGTVKTYHPNGKPLVALTASADGDGFIETNQPNGKPLMKLGSSDDGGLVHVYNKTGEFIVTMGADEYGNGVVYAGNRKGKGRTLKPGP